MKANFACVIDPRNSDLTRQTSSDAWAVDANAWELEGVRTNVAIQTWSSVLRP